MNHSYPTAEHSYLTNDRIPSGQLYTAFLSVSVSLFLSLPLSQSLCVCMLNYYGHVATLFSALDVFFYVLCNG